MLIDCMFLHVQMLIALHCKQSSILYTLTGTDHQPYLPPGEAILCPVNQITEPTPQDDLALEEVSMLQHKYTIYKAGKH